MFYLPAKSYIWHFYVWTYGYGYTDMHMDIWIYGYCQPTTPCTSIFPKQSLLLGFWQFFLVPMTFPRKLRRGTVGSLS